jgi:hypothetical protein
MAKLDAQERRLRESVERGEWREVRGGAAVKASAQRMAARHLRKKAKSSSRLTRS